MEIDVLTPTQQRAKHAELKRKFFPPQPKPVKMKPVEVEPPPAPEIIKYALGYNIASGTWGIIIAPLTAEQAPLPKMRTILQIIQHIGAYYGVAWHDMVSNRRFKVACDARQRAMYIARKVTNQSMPVIARQFGGRDHTTCLHAIRKIERLRLTDEKLDADLISFERELAAG